MFKLIKLVFYVLLILFILSPFFVTDSGLDPIEYVDEVDIDGGRLIEVDNYQTYYIDYNSDFEETILFLHGFGGSSTNWIPVMQGLKEKDYRIVSVDLKGFGFSEKKRDENYSHPAQVEFLNSFINKLDLQNITLVGHSMGGNVSVMYLQKYPERVERLVLVNAAILEQGDVDALRVNALKLLDWPIIREYARIVLKYSFNESRLERVLESAMYEPDNVELQEHFFVDPTIFLGWEYVLIKMSAASGENFLKESISEINLPTTIVWGEEDTWVPVSKGRYLDREIAGSEFEVLEEVGHLPMFEDTEAFMDILNRALDNS